MSEENVEAIRRSFELWLSGDIDAWLETVDPDVGWDFSNEPLIDVPNEGRGRKAFVEMLATYSRKPRPANRKTPAFAGAS